MKTYPVSLIGLAQRHAVVVGGGAVVARKVAALQQADARVTVISPDLTSELAALLGAGRIATLNRAYREGDLAAAFLVIAATDDAEVNRAVWREADRRGCLINVVDDPAHGTQGTYQMIYAADHVSLLPGSRETGAIANAERFEANAGKQTLRGGSWRGHRQEARCAYRSWAAPMHRSDDTGFRCCYEP